MNPKVDAWLRKVKKWQDEAEKLRAILLECPLTEEIKWGEPCYTLQGKNIVLIGLFKEYCALLFFKGALLSDPKSLLVAPGQLQAGRQMRFASVKDIAALETTIKMYVYEAMEAEQAGLKVAMKQHSDYEVPQELQRKLDADPALKSAFEALTPGRQRAYYFHIAKPKQAKTRELKVEQSIPLILAGKGLND